ncbi:hypothetical protein P692DRAFT_20877631 [Suillus brevipes Sb2]|nr:hypothetical protein P692DRAFT_20877631 [Suillus brevipes Sb2]
MPWVNFGLTDVYNQRIRPRSSALPGSTFLSHLFHRNPSDAYDTQSGEQIELQGRSPAVVEVPHAKGKRRNTCAREKRKRLLLLKNPIADSSQPPKPNATQQSSTATQIEPSLQPQPATSNSFTTPAVGDIAAATSSTPSRPDVVLRQAGLWTRFWPPLDVCLLNTRMVVINLTPTMIPRLSLED